MAVREALHGKSFERKGGFDNHDRHGVCQASNMLVMLMVFNVYFSGSFQSLDDFFSLILSPMHVSSHVKAITSVRPIEGCATCDKLPRCHTCHIQM